MLKNIKRIGKKTYKFQVDVFFEKVDVNIKFPCQLFIIWKRGMDPFFPFLICYLKDLVNKRQNLWR